MQRKTILVTGSRKGIGRFLVEYYTNLGYQVIGCSRSPIDWQHPFYDHHVGDVSDEVFVKKLLANISKKYGFLDILINNAGVAAMNHSLLTPKKTLTKVFDTNVVGTFLLCREAVKIMKKKNKGCIVNFSTVAVPLKLAGEAIYAASKAAVVSLTEILAKEFAPFGVTVNAIGPTPIETDLIRNIPKNKIDSLLDQQAIKRLGSFSDVTNVINFFINEESDFITGQTVYLGGVS